MKPKAFIKFLFLTQLFSTFSFTATIQIEGKSYLISQIKGTNSFISSKCLDKNKMPNNKNCLAAQALKNSKSHPMKRALIGGANPGAFFCIQNNGEYKLIIEEPIGEKSYCLFSDQTVINNGALTRATFNI